jgi:Tfp pilus assembly protein PilN
MINLLPADYVNSIRYARRNTALRAWLTAAVTASVLLVIILSAGWVYINQQAKTLQKHIDSTSQALKAQNLTQAQHDVKEISGDITVINKLLSQEVDFAKLMDNIGRDMPSGAVLSSLSLSDKVNGALDLSANTVDYASAAQVAANLSDPQNQLFSKVDIVSITCDTTSVKTYKCQSIYRALFSSVTQNKFMHVPENNS